MLRNRSNIYGECKEIAIKPKGHLAQLTQNPLGKPMEKKSLYAETLGTLRTV